MKKPTTYKPGGRIYYVPSLFFPAIRGKIVSVELFNGRPAWLTMETDSGEIIADYDAKFCKTKPATYNADTGYAKTYKNNMDGSVVSFRELRFSYEKYSAGKMTFPEYMDNVTKSGFLTPIEY
jgi:hypothetical protein